MLSYKQLASIESFPRMFILLCLRREGGGCHTKRDIGTKICENVQTATIESILSGKEPNHKKICMVPGTFLFLEFFEIEVKNGSFKVHTKQQQ